MHGLYVLRQYEGIHTATGTVGIGLAVALYFHEYSSYTLKSKTCLHIYTPLPPSFSGHPVRSSIWVHLLSWPLPFSLEHNVSSISFPVLFFVLFLTIWRHHLMTNSSPHCHGNMKCNHSLRKWGLHSFSWVPDRPPCFLSQPSVFTSACSQQLCYNLTVRTSTWHSR